MSRITNSGKEKKFPVTQKLYERVESIIYGYDGGIGLCEVIDTLELLRRLLIKSAEESPT